MDEMLCNEKHSQIRKELEKYNLKLDDHDNRIKELEQSDVGRSKDIESLCKSIESLNQRIDGVIAQNKWFLGILIVQLIGFFFYAVEKGILK